MYLVYKSVYNITRKRKMPPYTTVDITTTVQLHRITTYLHPNRHQFSHPFLFVQSLPAPIPQHLSSPWVHHHRATPDPPSLLLYHCRCETIVLPPWTIVTPLDATTVVCCHHGGWTPLFPWLHIWVYLSISLSAHFLSRNQFELDTQLIWAYTYNLIHTLITHRFEHFIICINLFIRIKMRRDQEVKSERESFVCERGFADRGGRPCRCVCDVVNLPFMFSRRRWKFGEKPTFLIHNTSKKGLNQCFEKTEPVFS